MKIIFCLLTITCSIGCYRQLPDNPYRLDILGINFEEGRIVYGYSKRVANSFSIRLSVESNEFNYRTHDDFEFKVHIWKISDSPILSTNWKITLHIGDTTCYLTRLHLKGIDNLKNGDLLVARIEELLPKFYGEQEVYVRYINWFHHKDVVSGSPHIEDGITHISLIASNKIRLKFSH